MMLNLSMRAPQPTGMSLKRNVGFRAEKMLPQKIKVIPPSTQPTLNALCGSYKILRDLVVTWRVGLRQGLRFNVFDEENNL